MTPIENDLQCQIQKLKLNIDVLQERIEKLEDKIKKLETKTNDEKHVESSPLELDYKLVKDWSEEHNVRKVKVCNWRGSLVVEDITGDFLNADDLYISKNAVSENTVGNHYLSTEELLQEIKDRMKYKF